MSGKMGTNPIIDEDSYFQRSDGLYVPINCLTPEMVIPKHKRPIGIDLFSGAGGFSLGFIQAGFDIIAALEWDPCCIQTYLVNLGAYPVNMVFIEDLDRIRIEKYLERQFKKVVKDKGKALTEIGPWECGGLMSGSNRHGVAPEFAGVKYMFVGDARKISGERMLEIMGLLPGEVDCVMGGPPCQGFSTSNVRRSTMDPRNSLVLDFARLVCEIKPKTMIMENVPGMLNMTTIEGIPVIDAICKILMDGNFGEYDVLRKTLLSSAGCGAALKKEKKIKRVAREIKHAGSKEPRQGQLFR